MGTNSKPPAVATRIDSLPSSSIRMMYDLANEMDGQLARLEVGEPDFTTPKHIIESAAQAARDGGTHYTSNAGLHELRQAIADEMARCSNLHTSPEEIVVTNGATEALHLALLSVVDPGDQVIIPTPGWPNYTPMVKLAGGEVVEVELSPTNDFDLDPSQVIDAISPETAAIILNSPCNPTGRLFDPDSVEQIAREATAHDAYIIADEVYEGFVYDGSFAGIGSYVDDPERVITINACSKKYAMTGWRLGWIVAQSEIADAASTLHQGTSSCASSVSQHAALAALTGDQTKAMEIQSAFKKRRDYTTDRIEKIPGISAPRPQGSFYAFVDVSILDGTSVDIAKRLMTDYGVVTAPGSGFGDAGEGFIRISFATDIDEIERGMNGLEKMVTNETDQ